MRFCELNQLLDRLSNYNDSNHECLPFFVLHFRLVYKIETTKDISGVSFSSFNLHILNVEYLAFLVWIYQIFYKGY